MPAWPGLPAQRGKLRKKNGSPVGCRPTGVLAAAIARHRRRSRGSHTALVLRRHPCRGAASLSKLLFPGPEWQLTQATVGGPDGLRYKGYGDGVYQTHSSYVAHAEDDVPDGVQWGAHGVYHVNENHGDDTGRGEDDDMEYVPVCLPAPQDGRGFSCSFGFSGVAGWRISRFGMVFHEMVSWFGLLGDTAGLEMEVGVRSSACRCSSGLHFWLMCGTGQACQCPSRPPLQRDEDRGRLWLRDRRNARLRGVTAGQTLTVYAGGFSGSLIPGSQIGDHSCTSVARFRHGVPGGFRSGNSGSRTPSTGVSPVQKDFFCRPILSALTGALSIATQAWTNRPLSQLRGAGAVALDTQDTASWSYGLPGCPSSPLPIFLAPALGWFPQPHGGNGRKYG